MDAQLCLALAPPREYVVQTSWQLYYCDVASDAGCVNHRDGSVYPNLTFVQRIEGPGNKQFLLFNNRFMRHGMVNSGYHVFQLVPKARNPRGYEFYMLAVGDHYFAGEGGLPPCRDLAAEEEAVEVRGVSVIGEGSRGVTLQFVTFVTPCSGGESSERTVEFKIVDGVLQGASASGLEGRRLRPPPSQSHQ